MIYYRIGDLLEQRDINVILHVANSYNTMQAGIALSIKNKYPEAYQADLKTIYGDKSKLGTFSWAKTQDGKMICNLYSMKGLGTNQRQLDYEAFYQCLEKVREFAKNLTSRDNRIIGIPYLTGCSLAGGKWGIVESMINDIFGFDDIKVVICVLPRFQNEINWQNVNVEEDKTYYK